MTDIERIRAEARAAALDEAANYLQERVAYLEKLKDEQITDSERLICIAVMSLARQIRALKDQP